MQQLEAFASKLDAVGRNVEQLFVTAEQLSAKQEQIVQNVATLQAGEEIRQKLSSTSPQAASIPPPKLPQIKAQATAVQSSSLPRAPSPAGPLVLSR